MSFSSVGAIISLNKEGNILSINKSTRDIFGIADEQMKLELNLRDLFKDPQQLRAILDEEIPSAFKQNFWMIQTCSISN